MPQRLERSPDSVSAAPLPLPGVASGRPWPLSETHFLFCQVGVMDLPRGCSKGHGAGEGETWHLVTVGLHRVLGPRPGRRASRLTPVTAEYVPVITGLLQVERWRLRQAKQLAQSHTDNEWTFNTIRRGKQPGFQRGRHHLCSAPGQELQADAHCGPKKRKGLTSTERGASHRDTPKSPLGSVCHPKHYDASFREKQMRKMKRETGGKYTNFQSK